MSEIDLDKIISEYAQTGEDFGFTEMSEVSFEQEVQKEVEEEVEKAVVETQQVSLQHAQEQLQAVEKLILPFLIRLMNAKEVYIKWPHEVREPVIKAQIEKILEITRHSHGVDDE